MALSPPSDYTTDIANPFTDNWLFQFFYGATNTTNYTGVSFKDITVTDQNNNSKAFNGCITNIPSIRESVNPVGGMVKTSNITVDINDTSLFDDFFGGSNYYINKTVIVWSVSNDTTDLDNALRIYTGRLKTISHTDSKMSFSIQSHRPFDDITIPNTKSTNRDIYFPISYGEFTPNATARDYRAIKTVRPMPVNEFRGTQLYSLIGIEDVTTDAYPHYYDKSLDRFIPVAEDGSYNFDTNADSYQGGFAVQSHYELERRITFKPVETTSSTGWTNPDNAFDDPDANETTNYASADFTQTNSGTSTKTIKFKMPQIEGKVTAVSMEIAYTTTRIVSISSGTPTVTFTLTNKTWGVNDAFFNLAITSAGTTSSSVTTDASASLLTQFNSQNGWADEIEIEAKVVGAGLGSYSGQFQPRINDVRLLATSEVDWDESTNKARQTANKVVSDIETLYTGGDGLVRSWDTGNVAEYGFNIHRDLLWRFAGVDATEYSAPTMNGSAWDDSAPSGFDDASEGKARVVILEPTPLVEVLDRLAYESCFMFRFGATENPQYISIKETESTDHTLTEDKITGLKVSHTPVSELKTKYIINSDPHPADDKYQTQATFTNSNRGNWIAIDEENIYTENLQYRYDNITEFHTYLDRLVGDIKLRVECKIVDPAIGVIVEVGDIVAFTNGSMTTKPFGATWDSGGKGRQFVVTETNKSIGGQCAVKLWEI